MPSTISVTCSLRAEASVNSPRISANSIATADTSVKALRWWRNANKVDMGGSQERRGEISEVCTEPIITPACARPTGWFLPPIHITPRQLSHFVQRIGEQSANRNVGSTLIPIHRKPTGGCHGCESKAYS